MYVYVCIYLKFYYNKNKHTYKIHENSSFIIFCTYTQIPENKWILFPRPQKRLSLIMLLTHMRMLRALHFRFNYPTLLYIYIYATIRTVLYSLRRMKRTAHTHNVFFTFHQGHSLINNCAKLTKYISFTHRWIDNGAFFLFAYMYVCMYIK